MFAFLEPEPWYKRWARGAFLFVTPLVFLPFLLRGRPSVIYISNDPFWISNYLPSSLPTFFAELVSYDYYQGTAAALFLAVVCATVCNRSRRGRTWKGPGLVWYLPAFVAGIEAMRHARLLGSRHGFTEVVTAAQLRRDWLTAGIASMCLVVACVLLGLVFAKAARDSTRVPLATVPLVLSVAGGWYAFLSLVWVGA